MSAEIQLLTPVTPIKIQQSHPIQLQPTPYTLISNSDVPAFHIQTHKVEENGSRNNERRKNDMQKNEGSELISTWLFADHCGL